MSEDTHRCASMRHDHSCPRCDPSEADRAHRTQLAERRLETLLDLAEEQRKWPTLAEGASARWAAYLGSLRDLAADVWADWSEMSPEDRTVFESERLRAGPVRDKQVHVLKTRHDMWNAVRAGSKKFEIRRDDRDIQEGDRVRLACTNPDGVPYSERAVRPLEFVVGPVFRFTEGECLTMFGVGRDGSRADVTPGIVAFHLEPFTDCGMSATQFETCLCQECHRWRTGGPPLEPGAEAQTPPT